MTVLSGGWSPFYRCFGTDEPGKRHGELRWAWVADNGRHCWYCGALGRPISALTITSSDAFIREIDDVLWPDDAA